MEATIPKPDTDPIEESPLDAAPGKKKPGPKPKGPKYEHPTLGRVIHVVTDMALASRLNCEQGIWAAAIVSDAGEGVDYFACHVFSPTRNPDVDRYLIFDTDGDKYWRWPPQV